MTADRHVCKLTLKAFFCGACSIPLHILYISLHILYIYIYMVSYIPCLSPASQRKSCFCLLFFPTLCVCVCTRVYEVRNQSLASFLSLSTYHSLTLHSKLPGPSCLHFPAMPCLLPMCWQSELRPPYFTH